MSNRRLTDQQRKDRAKMCGRPIAKANAKGNIDHYHYSCRQPRYCAFCAKKRADMFRDIGEQAWKDTKGNLIITAMSEKDARKLTRGMDKSLYIKMPMEDGQILLIARSDHDRFSGIESSMSIDDIDWAVISQTPEGKRMSGKLGKVLSATSDTPESEEEKVKVETVRGILDFDGVENKEKIIAEAIAEAKHETSYLNPQFHAYSLERAMNIRTCAYLAALKRRNVKILDRIWQTETINAKLYSTWDTSNKISVLELAVIQAKRLGWAIVGRGFEVFQWMVGNEIAARTA